MNIGIRSFFQVAFPCHFRTEAPVIDGNLNDWDTPFLVPDLTGIDGKTPFADVYMAWNHQGVYVAVETNGLSATQVDTDHPLRGDGLQIWIDTRDVRTASRGSRYCHHFCFWPGVESEKPGGRQFRLRRARAQARLCDADQLHVASRVSKSGYCLELHILKSALTGFDPDENNRLGFTYLLKDRKLGRQFWTADETLPVSYDPSLWGTAELVK